MLLPSPDPWTVDTPESGPEVIGQDGFEELAQLIRDGVIVDPIDAHNQLVQLQTMDYAKQGKEAMSSAS